jgi:SAM-dependent methyltransferase
MMPPSPYTAAPVTCPACGADLTGAAAFAGVDRLMGTPGTFEVRVCGRCGSGATYPPAGPAELAAFYPDTYGPYDQPLRGVLGLVSRAIRAWQDALALAQPPLATLRSAPPGRLVDVGCGRGDLAALFVGRGWRATGIEPSQAAVAIAAARSVDARVGTLADVPLEEDAYDAAVFQHSLEHTPDPLGDLQRVWAALRPGGRVLITVPNFSSWQRRRFRDRWFHLDLPRHRTHFSTAGLRAVLERAGLAVEQITTSTSAAGLPATVQYAIAGRCLFPGGLAQRVAIGLCALTLPPTWVLNRLGGGGDLLHAVAVLRP